jgi:hypothetical protein
MRAAWLWEHSQEGGSPSFAPILVLEIPFQKLLFNCLTAEASLSLLLTWHTQSGHLHQNARPVHLCLGLDVKGMESQQQGLKATRSLLFAHASDLSSVNGGRCITCLMGRTAGRIK